MPDPSPNRIKRLQHEAKILAALASRSTLIELVPEGLPPTSYLVKLTCAGWMIDPDDPTQKRLVHSQDHRFRMSLGGRFPSDPPKVEWLTRIFHPNFRGNEVCLGDLWAGTDSLADLVVTIARMVQYKEFNTADPLDPVAASWVLDRLDEAIEGQSPFPLDDRPVVDLDFDLSVVQRKSVSTPGAEEWP